MLLQKLQRLGMAASWDSCGSGKQKNPRKSIVPVQYRAFIHECSQTQQERKPCRLMKILQSNNCIHECKYCANSTKCNKKTELKPKELVQAFNFLTKKRLVQGLFLSSAVTRDADTTAEKIIESARILRFKAGFKGYIHLKVLPGMSKEKIREMAELADRLSLNIEVPDGEFLSEIAPTKNFSNDLEKRLKWINELKEKGILKSFTTQFIAGATKETDLNILKKMHSLYKKTKLYRSYFSAFEPVKGTSLEKTKPENPWREHRLYQADWLLRIYGFKLRELKLALDSNGMLSLHKDPKMAIAVNCPNKHPLDPNNATKEELLQVPGIGPKAAEKIEAMKKTAQLTDFNELKKCGVILQRAMPFLQLEGKRQTRITAFQ